MRIDFLVSLEVVKTVLPDMAEFVVVVGGGVLVEGNRAESVVARAQELMASGALTVR